MSDRKDDSSGAGSSKRKPLARVVDDMVHLAPWRKKLFGLFLAIAAVGGGLWAHGWMTAEPTETSLPPAEVRLSTDGSGLPDNARGFVSNGDNRSAADAAAGDAQVEPETADKPGFELPWTGRLGGWMARLGVSFVLGLVIGVFFRTFLKTMAVLTALAVAALVGLSYFDVIGVDFAHLRTNYDAASGWISGQAGHIKTLAMGVLPSITAGGAGFLVGFLRR